MSVTTATLVTEPGAASCPENPASGPRVRNAPYSCDLQDIPKRILKTPRLVPVAHMDEVLRVALALIHKESMDFLKEPSVAVDWRVPIERRGRWRQRRPPGLFRWPAPSPHPTSR